MGKTPKLLLKFKWMNEIVSPYKGQDFYEIKQKLSTTGELFKDPEFLCDDDVLFYKQGDKKNSYKWLRPSEIVETPKFIVDDLSRSDVLQGQLGDCWFLAGIGSLADKEKFLNRVVCVDNTFDVGNYAGIFHFRFWDFGEWVDVVIDDRLPVDDDNDLVYLKSKDKNEFWTPLLEKAYAKFKGGYANLHSGKLEFAFQDFSGGILETFTLTGTPESALEFFNKKLRRNSMIGSTVKDSNDKTQLPSGHAYTISGAMSNDHFSLVRIRNPWGDSTEWRGPWSDNSPEWRRVPDEIKEKIKFKIEEDGEFWMSYNDFIKYFNKITICNLTPHENPDQATEKWEKDQFKGEWVAGITAGGSSDYEETYHFNPQYMLTIYENYFDDTKKPNSVVIAMLQRPIKNELQKFKFDVYKVEERDYEIRPMKRGFFENNRPIKQSEYAPAQETHVRLELLPGRYLIVPSTKTPDKEGEFLIRVYVDNRFKLEQYDKKVEKTEESKDGVKEGAIDVLLDENALSFIFKDYAKGYKISWKELKNILDNLFNDENIFSKQLSRSVIAMVSRNYHRTIDFQKFKKLMKDLNKWLDIFKSNLDGNEETLKAQKLRDIFRSLGLNVDTNILNSLVFTYASDKVLTLDDFLMCVVKAKTLIDHLSDDKIKATDRWTLRTFL